MPNLIVRSQPGELPAVEGQGGGFEEKQPSSEEHKHVRCLHITSLFANSFPRNIEEMELKVKVDECKSWTDFDKTSSN